jgi:hypothetical protein
MTPDNIRALKAVVISHRGSLDGYDIMVGGSTRRTDWDEERAYIRSLAGAGVTWWAEYIPPDTGDLDVVRASVARGPLRID